MNEINSLILDASNWLSARGIFYLQVPQLAVVIAILALLLSIVSVRRSRKLGVGMLMRLNESVERLNIAVRDLESKTAAHAARTNEEVANFRERLRRLDGGDLETSQDIEGKRYPDLLRKEPSAEQEKVPSVLVPAVTATAVTTSDGATAESKGFFSGLKKTRDQFFSRLSAVVSRKEPIGPETFEAIEELLITSDLGVGTSHRLLNEIKASLGTGSQIDEAELKRLLKHSLLDILSSDTAAEIVPAKRQDDPLVILMVGVNGVGKTTTIGKLAARFSDQGAKVILGACDTFRAAAVEQLTVWGDRAGVKVVSGAEGAKPTTVAFEALKEAREGNYDVLLLDTAGRLHTRVNLMNELTAIVKLVERELPGAPHETLLVLDASTGQNALQQAKEFHERVNLTGIVMTKLDGTPKGGIVVAIRSELGVPVRYVGFGEAAGDLRVFSPQQFLDALLG